MKPLKLCFGVALLAAMTLLTSCRTGPVPQATSEPPAEVLQKQYLYEVLRHLYRWQLDDAETREVYGDKEVVFWVQRLNPHLDPGDNSVLAEIFLPQLDMSVKVKKADYRIEELDTPVKSLTFKIVQVTRGHMPVRRPVDAVEIRAPLQEIRDHLFNTRNQREYPDAALIERFREALHEQVVKEERMSTNIITTDQIVYLSPLSPVANEAWVFWEDRRILFHFASDSDLTRPALWEHKSLMVRIFDIDQQVVASHEEAPGSNRFLTRNQVGRVLYNCVVLGKRITVTPRGSSPPATPQTPPKGQ